MRKVIYILILSLLLCSCSNETIENTTVETTEPIIEETAVETIEETEPTISHVYSLEGMSVEEIYNELIALSYNTGEFIVEPNEMSYTDTYYFDVEGDSIDNIYVSIDVGDVEQFNYMEISFVLHDIDKTSEIYDMLFNYLIDYTNVQSDHIVDNREGDNWRSYLYFYWLGGYYYEYNIYMDASEDGYFIDVVLPILNQEEI